MNISSIIRWFRLNIEFDVERSRNGFYFFKVNDTYVCISNKGVDCKVWEKLTLPETTYKVQICFSNKEIQPKTTLNNSFSDLFQVNQYSYIGANLSEENLGQIKERIFEINNGEFMDPLGICKFEEVKALPPFRYTIVRIDDNGHTIVGKIWNNIERARNEGRQYLQTHNGGNFKLEVMVIVFGQIGKKLYPKTFPIADGEITENKTNKNMKKNVQRINESQLRAIVAESVKKVLKESHSMEIEAALQDICRASSLIRNKTEYTQEGDYEPDYEIGYNDAAYLHKWASEIEGQAGEWLRN